MSSINLGRATELRSAALGPRRLDYRNVSIGGGSDVRSSTTPVSSIQSYPRSCSARTLLMVPAAAAHANVVTDWDEKAMELIQGNGPAPPPQIGGPIGGLRIATIMHIAIFQAENTIDPRYEPYQGRAIPKAPASPDAAATAAASTVLMKLLPTDGAAKVSREREAYLAEIPDGEAKTLGIKLGDEAAIKVIEARVDDGNDRVDAFRPVTQPGVYTETMPVNG